MTRSEGHQCEVCGTYGFHGFKQANGDYHWYCLHHRLEGYKLPDLAPPPAELKGQIGFDFGGAPDHRATFQRFVAGGRPWADCLEAYVAALPPGTEALAERWRLDVESQIGRPPNPEIVGSVIRQLKVKGWIEGTGRLGAPIDKKSNSSRKEILRRTDKR